MYGYFLELHNLTTAHVVCITAVINRIFISFSAVEIYDISYIHLQDTRALKSAPKGGGMWMWITKMQRPKSKCSVH